ncbi:signal peptidase I [Lysobacter pythonis]|uniref:Signal peptidase I n=1 Tax=Solilutibacter pythonis TaxID=2483112 RepID=A0A3M2HL77_9GAMM|nr:signal peptidase I [Lysobacter pythonis]RMH88350.1 signal peptidase I [Lysobacter pythonis]
MRWFEITLVTFTLVTAVFWALDKFVLRKRRAEAGLLAEEHVPWYIDYSNAFFPVLLAILILRSFIAEPFRIPTGSMIPTLKIGDFILVNKFAYGLRLPVTNSKIVSIGEPERGDVAVFRYPGMGKDDPDAGIDFVKRVIGMPGDHVVYQRGVLTINGKPLAYKARGPVEIRSGDDGIALPGMLIEETVGKRPHLVQNYLQSLEQGGMGDGEFQVPPGHYLVMGDNRDNSLDGRFWGMLPEKNLRGKAFLVWMNWNKGVDFSRIGERIP